MVKVAIIVLADTETYEDFDGAGTKWIIELSKPDHMFHELFESLKDKYTGACSFCAGAFGVKKSVMASNIPLVEEYEGHPCLRESISQGYQIITF